MVAYYKYFIFANHKKSDRRNHKILEFRETFKNHFSLISGFRGGEAPPPEMTLEITASWLHTINILYLQITKKVTVEITKS